MRLGIVLLLASAVQAQPVVGPEVVWRTTSPAATYYPARQAARIAVDGAGYVVAWSEVLGGASRACTGTLTSAGRLAQIGVCAQGVSDAPSVEPFGDRYIAAWLEPVGSDARPVLVTAALDRDFALIAGRPVGLTATPPIVRVAASRAYVAGGALYEVDRDGAPLVVYDVPHPIDDLAASGDQVGYVVRGMTPRSTVGFTWLYRLTAGLLLAFPNEAPAAAVAGGNNGFVVIWSEHTPFSALKVSIFGMAFNPFVITPHEVERTAQPQAAWDGTRWVAVWERQGSIEAGIINTNLTTSLLPPIAHGSRPAIAASKGGRFLITYEVIDSGKRRLVSRLIDFSPPRRDRVIR